MFPESDDSVSTRCAFSLFFFMYRYEYGHLRIMVGTVTVQNLDVATEAWLTYKCAEPHPLNSMHRSIVKPISQRIYITYKLSLLTNPIVSTLKYTYVLYRYITVFKMSINLAY